MTKPRATRTKPATHTQAQLTSRDRAPLESLAWAGFLSTGQIEKLHYPSRRVAQRRLRALLDHGLVRAALQGTALQNDNIFALTMKGVDYLKENETYDEATTIRPGRLPRVSKAAHGLRIRDIFVEVELAERAGLFKLKNMMIESMPFAGCPIIPDLTIEFDPVGDAKTLFIEVDLASETSSCLRRKFERYALFLGAHHLLVLVEREGRRQTMQKLLTGVGLGARVEVALFSEFGVMLRDPTHPVFARPRLFERTTEREEEPCFPEDSQSRTSTFRVLPEGSV